ncbi:MAG: SLC13 family permease [Lachnospirales bacterium]
MNEVVLAVSIFVITYGIIISEKINKVAISILGATLVVMLGILSQEQAIDYIEFNTIGLLIGMMVIVGVLKSSGIFEYLAIYVAKKVKGDPWKILVILGVLTAFASAFLDNVTVVLLVAPVTLVITETLDIDARPFLISQILLSNIGGTATLIGDPPNVMIGSSTNLTFNDFLVNLAPVVVIVTIVFIICFKFMLKKYAKNMESKKENIELLMSMDEKASITNPALLKKSIIVLALTILSFWLSEAIHIELSILALFFAGVMLTITYVDVEEIFVHVEWTTLTFFVALFVLVGALVQVGFIDTLASGMVNITHGDVLLATMIILWGSGLASSFLNNIPFVATMIPLITAMGTSGMDIEPLWWALALGACFGGNGTIIGSSAGVIVVGVCEKRGQKISFMQYFKAAFPLTLISLLISSIYLYVKFFLI